MVQQAAETYSGYQGLLGLQADEFANLTAAEKEAEGRYAVWKTLLELQEKVIDWTTGPLLSRQDNSVRPANPDSAAFAGSVLITEALFIACPCTSPQQVGCVHTVKASKHSTWCCCIE